MTTQFQKARDEEVRNNKWEGPPIRSPSMSFLAGANWAEIFILTQDERVKALVEALKRLQAECPEELLESSLANQCEEALLAFETAQKELEGK